MFIPIGDANDPGARTPVLTWSFLVINVVVFFYQQMSPAFTYGYSLIPREIVTFQDIAGVVVLNGGMLQLFEGPSPVQLTLVTSMFMHGGWMHLLGNMLYLWVFGDNVEDRLGSWGFLKFYLLCGVIAAACQILISPLSYIPVLGASGAIAGVLGAYLALFPGNRVKMWVFVFIIPVPAAIVLLLWIVAQFQGGLGNVLAPGDGGGVAYAAHIGGFIAGFVLGLRERKKKRGAVDFNGLGR